MTRIAPTVGRKLYFYPGGDTSVHKLDDQPVDATIIYVWPQSDPSQPQYLNLHVIDHTGTQQTKTSVPLVQDGEGAPVIGNYAMWMPFQVGQAKAQNEPATLQVPMQTLDQLSASLLQNNPGLSQNMQQGSIMPTQYAPSFQGALTALKDGRRVARSGWNGKGMFAYMVPAASYPAQTGAAKAHYGDNALVPYNAYFALKGVDNTVSTWVPSVSDLLAEDWEVLQ